RIGRRVALKVIRPDQRLDPMRKARFLREARVLSALDHPHVCQFHDYIEGEDRDCLVLELVEGRSLREVMNDGLEPEDKLDIAEQLLDVLVAVHGQGVIHRDLKPENIMITDNGIKVLDFGLARPVEDPESLSGEFPAIRGEALSETGAGRSMTSAGTVLGTISYMSPEVARGEPATAASDLYATGLILHELLTGRRAIPDDLPAAECHRRAMWSELEPLTGLSSELAGFIARLESLVPGNRPSAIDAATMLRVIRDRPRRRRRRWVVAAVWTLLAVFGAGMTVQYLRAEKLTRRAEQEAATAREVSRFLMGLFEQGSPEVSTDEALTVQTLLRRGAESLDDELRGQPAVRATMLHTLGTVQYQLGRYDEATSALTQALGIYRETLGVEHPFVGDVLHSLGRVAELRGDLDEASRLYLESLRVTEATRGPDHRLVGDTVNNLADVRAKQGRCAEAEGLYARALAVRTTSLDPDDPRIADTLEGYAECLERDGRSGDAAELEKRARAIRSSASAAGS
ncbi:MAG: serine/threonine-protein kinase, partial [Holophagae bacterium]